MTTTSLLSPELSERWKELHAELAGPFKAQGLCREPFLGYRPEEMNGAALKFAYVGKATGGDLSSEYVEHTYRFNSSPFWSFARELRDSLALNTGQTTAFSWSNVCKIGVTKGNPSEDLITAQKPLSVESLRFEMSSSSLDLVVLVCENFADQLVYEALAIGKADKGGPRDFEPLPDVKHGGWRRKRMEGFSPILWLRHPQGKLLEARSVWVSAAQDLISGER